MQARCSYILPYPGFSGAITVCDVRIAANTRYCDLHRAALANRSNRVEQQPAPAIR